MKKTLYNIVTTSKRAALIVIVIVISIFLLYSSYVYKNLNIEVITLLKESTNKTAAILENKINSHQHSVQDLALSISDENVMSDKNIQLLKKIIENYNYLRMGVVDKNLKAVTTDGKIVQLTESEYLNKAFNGSVSVSEQIFDVVDGNPIIVYAAPVFTSDYSSVQAILFATFSISEYHDTLSSHVFDSQGCSYILKNNGAIITSNCYLMSPESSNNLFHYIKKIHGDNANDIKCMENKIIKGNEGYIKVKDKISSSSFVEKYYYFTPLGFNDWVYVTSVPVTILHKEMTLTLLSTLILACIIIVITISILSILLNNQKKSKVALEDMIYKNKITGNLSYEKFKMEAIQLLRKKEYNYALVVIDIEKFNYINDMFGYTEGDNLIRFIDSVLLNNCHKNELTSHILGDDFIMLLRTTDRESLCRRLEKFNEKNIKIIMDDFGVGFSSIGLIKEIDIAALKIDRSFVLDINENYKSKLIVEAIIKLMKRLNIKVNAEGIETLEQAESLTQLGCDEIQGYYYDKPLTKEDFEKRMISKAKKQS